MKRESSFLKTALLCLICTFFWGAGYPILKLSYSFWGIGGGDVSGKLLFAGIRFTAAGGLLLLVSSVRHRAFARPGKSVLGWVAVLGLFQTALQYSFTYMGTAGTTGSKSSVLNQLSVFLTVIFAPLLFPGEKLTAKKISGCLLGFAGILVMNLKGLSFSMEPGDPLILLASCFAATGYLISKAMPKSFDSMTATAWQQLLGGIALLAAGLLGGGKLAAVSLPGLGCLLFLILAAAVSYSLWYYLLQQNEIGRISVSKFLTPLFGVLFSGILLGEPIFTPENGIALVLVCAGIVTVNSTKRA